MKSEVRIPRDARGQRDFEERMKFKERLEQGIKEGKIELCFPYLFEIVDLGKTIDDKIAAVKKVSGKVALISNAHSLNEYYQLALLKYIESDNECYRALIPRVRTIEEHTMHYHDLQGLMVAIGVPAFSKTYKYVPEYKQAVPIKSLLKQE